MLDLVPPEQYAWTVELLREFGGYVECRANISGWAVRVSCPCGHHGAWAFGRTEEHALVAGAQAWEAGSRCGKRCLGAQLAIGMLLKRAPEEGGASPLAGFSKSK